MDDVAEILAGKYGVRQQGKSIAMASSKSFPKTTLPTTYSGMPSDLRDDDLKSFKEDDVLKSLGMGLKEIKGLGFEELVYQNKKTDDPFLIFEKDYPLLYQSADHSVSFTNAFDLSDGIETCVSSFASNGSRGRIKDHRPSDGQNLSNAQNPYLKKPLHNDLNTSISAPNLLNLDDNFEFFSANVADVKKMPSNEASDENNNYLGIEAFFSDIGLVGGCSPLKMETTSEITLNAPFEMLGVSRGRQENSTGINLSIKELSSLKTSKNGLSFGIVQDIDGDNEYRRWARCEQERRKMERAANALAEKNEHDFELERENREREKIAEELETKVKRWAAGKEGNLRALISTLQDVLWPECGWLPLSLANLMTCTDVKKAYGKAALCIHPDKVQQKGATLRQKYTAEKVFYVLTEALNKFSSEELS